MLGVLGLLFGLVVLAATFVMPLISGAKRLDAQALLRERFEVGALPFELEPIEAQRLPAGEEVVVFGHAGDAALELTGMGLVDRAGGARSEEEQSAPPPKVAWSELPIGEKGRPPARIALVWVPRSMAANAVREAFSPPTKDEKRPESGRGHGPRRMRESFGGGMGGNFIGPEGGTVVQGGGELSWGEWGTNWVHFRTYELIDGVPGFRDSMRVNLSLAGRSCILHAIWDANLPAELERVKEFLAALGPKA
jgi:hypothetical protein